MPSGSLHLHLAHGPMSTTRFAPTSAAQYFCGTSEYNAYQLALCHGTPGSEACYSVNGLYICPQKDRGGYQVVVSPPRETAHAPHAK